MESKLEVGLPSGKLNCPPNNCMPSKAKMKMKRKRRSSSDKMEEMAFIKATTRLRSEVQYLGNIYIVNPTLAWSILAVSSCPPNTDILADLTAARKTDNYLVTLNTRSSLRALKAERPKEPALSLMLTQTISPIEPRITMQSKRLKEEEK